MHHVGLVVADLDASLAWYQGKLGASVRLIGEIPEYNCRAAFVDLWGTELELIEIAGSKDNPSSDLLERSFMTRGWSHIAYQVDDVDAATRELELVGVRVLEGPTDYVPTQVRTANLCDLDGHVIELVQDLPHRE